MAKLCLVFLLIQRVLLPVTLWTPVLSLTGRRDQSESGGTCWAATAVGAKPPSRQAR